MAITYRSGQISDTALYAIEQVFQRALNRHLPSPYNAQLIIYRNNDEIEMLKRNHNLTSKEIDARFTSLRSNYNKTKKRRLEKQQKYAHHCFLPPAPPYPYPNDFQPLPTKPPPVEDIIVPFCSIKCIVHQLGFDKMFQISITWNISEVVWKINF
jgi:hypothetical protein